MSVLKTVNTVNDGLIPVFLNGKLAFLSDAPNSKISFLISQIENEKSKIQFDVYESLACFKEDISVRLNHLRTATIEDKMFDNIDLTDLGVRGEQFLSVLAQNTQDFTSALIEFSNFEYCDEIEIFAELIDITTLLNHRHFVHHTTDDEKETIRLAIGEYMPAKHDKILSLDNLIPELLLSILLGLKQTIKNGF